MIRIVAYYPVLSLSFAKRVLRIALLRQGNPQTNCQIHQLSSRPYISALEGWLDDLRSTQPCLRSLNNRRGAPGRILHNPSDPLGQYFVFVITHFSVQEPKLEWPGLKYLMTVLIDGMFVNLLTITSCCWNGRTSITPHINQFTRSARHSATLAM